MTPLLLCERVCGVSVDVDAANIGENFRSVAARDTARFGLKANRLALREQLSGNKGLESLPLQNGGGILFAGQEADARERLPGAAP